jgi:hypothetical protein
MQTRNIVLLSATFAVLVAAVMLKVVPPKLSAEVNVENADIGIPGVTKMYEATLTNRGFLPVRVSRCDFIDDASAPGTMVAFAVQRWDKNQNRWETIADMSGPQFCKPYPLGIVEARRVNRWLWPGQRLSTGEEATAARGGFSLGDEARFVIFTETAGEYGDAVMTPGFLIDERPQPGTNFRIRH